VLSTPGVYTAFPETSSEYTTDSAGEQGILGGGNYPEGTPPPLADDFEWTFTIDENGRRMGTVTGLTDSHCVEGDCDEIEVTPAPDAVVDFPETLDCVNGVCPITIDNHATITQDDNPKTYVGLAVLKPDFYAYHLVNLPDDSSDYHPEPILAFGGEGYGFGTPSGRTYAFDLLPDVKEGQFGVIAPFAGAGSFPAIPKDQNGNVIGIPPSISPLLYRETDSNPQSQAVWLQTSLYIKTTADDLDTEGNEFDQQSFVNIALGGVGEDGGLVGARRGGASVDFTYHNECEPQCGPTTKREAFAFTGDIASLAGPDDSHFLGADEPNIVIGLDSTGTHNIGRDIPLSPNSSSVENQSGATYHIGVGAGTVQTPPQTLNGELKGYAVGMVKSEIPASNFLNVVASTSPDDFKINFNSTTNTLSADLTVHSDILGGGDGATDAYHIGFGDDPESPANKSAYIDDLHYAAIESGSVLVTNRSYQLSTNDYYQQSVPYEFSTATAYMASGDQLGVDSQLLYPTYNPEAEEVEMTPGAFCQSCDFLQWGAWGARVGFGNGSDSDVVDNVHLGWWVAGDVITDEVEGDLPFQGSATYSGHALGNVANNLSGQLATYVATGNMDMSWNFGQRNGRFDITNFDKPNTGGLDFGGTISMPVDPTGGLNKFSGTLGNQNLTGNLAGLTGGVNGSFVRPLSEGIPSGAIGNWNVGNSRYQATGIFAGAKQ
jgi:hypothetical protein